MEEKTLKIKNLMTNLRNWNDWDIKHYPLSREEAEVIMDVCLKMVPTKRIEYETKSGEKPIRAFMCPNEECGQGMLGIHHFCPKCGQAILQEEGEEDELL